jgi:Putative beta-barrel porin-2, OmpL-like. bbp2
MIQPKKYYRLYINRHYKYGQMKKILLSMIHFITGAVLAQSEKEKPAFNWSGYMEVYYQYDLNKPPRNSRPAFVYSFNRNNEINLNIGFIKGSYSGNGIRVALALMAGTYTQANLIAEPEALRSVYEANIGIKLSKTHNVWLDAGIFTSHIGFESAVGKDCWNLTRSMAADNSPYYESGLKIGYTSRNEKWFIAGLLLNGWQRIRRVNGNTSPAIGTQVTYKPAAGITLNSSSFIGNDKPDSLRQMRYFHNFYGLFQLNKQWAATIGFDWGAEQKFKGSTSVNNWLSPVLIVKYTPSAATAIAARMEYYSDVNAVIIATGTPNGFKTWGYSINTDYAIRSNVLWRLEARILKSRDRIFEKYNQRLVNTSTSLSSSLSVSF